LLRTLNSNSLLDSSPQQSFLQIQEQAKKLSFNKPQKEFQSSLSKLNKELDRVSCKKAEQLSRRIYAKKYYKIRNSSKIFQ
jgi:hypothetical protein